MPIIAGMDPGKRGAICILDTDKGTIRLFDMPVVDIGKTKTRTEVDGQELARILDADLTEAYLEDVWSTPNDGHVGAFAFGDAYGTAKGVLAGLGVPLTRIRPQVWKKTMRVSSDKNESRARAQALLPDAATYFSRVKDDGRAEAALIALYGCFDNGLIIRKPFKVPNETA